MESAMSIMSLCEAIVLVSLGSEKHRSRVTHDVVALPWEQNLDDLG